MHQTQNFHEKQLINQQSKSTTREEGTMTSTSTTPTTGTPGKSRPALEAATMYADNIKDKIYVITGDYSGIGVETVKALLSQGAKTVVVGGRNSKLQEEFVTGLADDRVDGSCTIDLGNLASVQAFAKYVNDKYSSINVLILNAGVMNAPAGVTKDGFEMQMGVNVIGHFLLAKLLADKTKRQVWVASAGHAMFGGNRIDIDYCKSFSLDTSPYSGWEAYQQSKLGNVLLGKEFGRHYPQMESASLHPGAISTNLGRHTSTWGLIKFMVTVAIPALFSGNDMSFKSVEAGASTTITAAGLPSDQFVQGAYYDNCEVGKESENAKNQDDSKALFDYCDEVTKSFQ
jgi:NAD(P)-dependent dehydrogenase (short-subunit alcohol dehydrogenase family)